MRAVLPPCGFDLHFLPDYRLPGSSDGRVGAEDLGQADPLEQGMAAHSSILAWRIPWTEEPGGLQSLLSQRVRYG